MAKPASERTSASLAPLPMATTCVDPQVSYPGAPALGFLSSSESSFQAAQCAAQSAHDETVHNSPADHLLA
jgi:hypothetical protein